MAKHWKTLLNGIIKENPVLVLALGTCPTLAVTTMAFNGLGMGLAATLVLIGTNTMISLYHHHRGDGDDCDAAGAGLFAGFE